MDVGGLDFDGRGFRSAEEMRRGEIGLDEPDTDTDTKNNKRHERYSKGISYWEGVKASVDGVLGGYGHVNDADVKVGLKPNGFFMVKENVARNGFVLHNEDRSVTRSDPYFKDLFHQNGLVHLQHKGSKRISWRIIPCEDVHTVDQPQRCILSMSAVIKS